MSHLQAKYGTARRLVPTKKPILGLVGRVCLAFVVLPEPGRPQMVLRPFPDRMSRQWTIANIAFPVPSVLITLNSMR